MKSYLITSHLSNCRFIVDLGFMAEQWKHCQFYQSTLHLYNALGVRPLGFSGLMYLQCPGCGHVAKIKLGKTHHSWNNKRGIGTLDINTTGAFFSCGIRIILCHNFLPKNWSNDCNKLVLLLKMKTHYQLNSEKSLIKLKKKVIS
jgi:hypothetical protein